MSVDLHAGVTVWLADRALADVNASGSAQIGLDRLLGHPPRLAATSSVLCLELAVILARDTDRYVDGYLTIPLPAADSLVQVSPTLDEVMGRVWPRGHEAPALHLVRPWHWQRYEGVEEYRRHLPAGELLPRGYVAYYRTWRTQSTSAFTFRRAIWVRTVDET